MATDFATTADPDAEMPGPDEPIPYTLTPQAEAYLDGPGAALDLAEPEPEAGL